MNKPYLALIACLLLAALLAGCTGEPATTAATPAPTTAVITTEPAATATTSGPPLAGTTWNLGWYDDTKGVWSSVVQGSTITATFSGDSVLSGSNGCTDYTTEYKLLAAPGIWIRRPEVPDTYCSAPLGVGSQQSAYYTDLMNAESYTITGSQLLMFDRTGKKILQFDPLA